MSGSRNYPAVIVNLIITVFITEILAAAIAYPVLRIARPCASFGFCRYMRQAVFVSAYRDYYRLCLGLCPIHFKFCGI